mgnify:CR=1 FL=1
MEDAPKAAPVVDTAPAPAPSVTQDDEDDTMDYFQKLAHDQESYYEQPSIVNSKGGFLLVRVI